MTYGFAISQQFELLLNSLGFGFIVGLFYRFVMTVREQVSSRKPAVILFDILFSVITTVTTYCFLLIYADGQIRLIALLAESAGYAFYMMTVDSFVKKLLCPPVRVIVKAIRLIFRPFSVLISSAAKLIKSVVNRIRNKCSERTERIKKRKPQKEKTVRKRKSKKRQKKE